MNDIGSLFNDQPVEIIYMLMKYSGCGQKFRLISPRIKDIYDFLPSSLCKKYAYLVGDGPVPVLNPAYISCGGNSMAIVTVDGKVYTFNRNYRSSQKLEENMTLLSGLPPCSSVSCGDRHAAILTREGQVYMFGNNMYGQLGFGDRQWRWDPTLLKGLPQCSTVSCGREHTALLTREGQVYMLGNNMYGQLGLGDRERRLNPILLPNLPPCVAVSCGDSHTAVLTQEGQVYTFGNNYRGQLGSGDDLHRQEPNLLGNLPPCSTVSCGYLHTAVLTRNGQIYMFGSNEHDQLGLGGVRRKWRPALLKELSPKDSSSSWVAVSCGNNRTAALNQEGQVYVFGNNDHNYFGFGDERGISKPTLLRGLPPCSFISCGEHHIGLICTEVHL